MKITVVPLATTSGKADYVTELERHATINDLKILLQENYGIPIHQQLLLLPSPSPSSSSHHFTSPYGPLLPLDTAFGLSDDSSTVYLTLRLRVLVEEEKEFLLDLNWGCTICNLRDQVKSLTKIPTNKMSISWGTLKFSPYKECTLESMCDGLWDNPTQPFVVKDIISIVSSYNDIDPLLGDGLFFGVRYTKAGPRPMIIDALDPPGTPIPLPEGLSSIDFIKDDEIKFVILWLGSVGALEELLVRFNFHQKSSTRCVVVKGERDLATYCFLRKLKADLVNVPICALTDCDPCSLKVLTFLRHPLVEFPPKLQRQFGGEWKKKAAVYGAMIEIKWIGVKPSYNRFFQMEKFDMTEKNLETANELLEEDGFAGMFPEWAQELKLMIEYKEMAKLEAFSAFGAEYLSSVFLIQELGKHRCCRIKHDKHVRY